MYDLSDYVAMALEEYPNMECRLTVNIDDEVHQLLITTLRESIL